MAAATSVHDDDQVVTWDSPCPGGSGVPGSSGHRVRVVGYLRGGRHRGVDCDQPLRVVCSVCPASAVWPCGCHRASRCAPCSLRYRRRLARIAEAGATRSEGHVYLLTLTAPGEDDHQQWDPGRLRGERPVCGCHRQVVEGGLGRWNAGASACWNRLRTAIRREVADVEFLRSVEVQTRGALHLHVLLWSPVPVDVLQVQDLALAAGFGCVLDLDELQAGRVARAAGYVAKYVTKAVDQRGEVPWLRDVVDQVTGEVTESDDPTYRAWSASRGWGLTMVQVRAVLARAAQAHAQRLRSLGTATPVPSDSVSESGPAESPPTG